jgi:hypothetical protein
MTAGGDSVTPPKRVLFAIGTAEYTDSAYRESEQRSREPDSLFQSVPQSVSSVVDALQRSRVEAKLQKGFLLNPSTKQLRRTLAEVGSAGDIVIIYYTGHGEEFGSDGYYLITTDFEKSNRLETGVVAADLPKLVVKRGEDGEIDRQQPLVLLILDCCFLRLWWVEVLRTAVSGGPHPNLWVWATAGKTQYAISGVFGRVLAGLLRRPNVGPSSEYIPLDTVMKVIERALDGTYQRAEMFARPGFSTLPAGDCPRTRRRGTDGDGRG